MFRSLFATDKGLSGTILRVLLGIVIFPHGAQKLLGWFGGGGFTASMRWFESSFHIPTIFALLAILAESVGAVAIGIALMIKGGGRWSLDGVIAKKLKR